MNRNIARLLVCFFVMSWALMASAEDVTLTIDGKPALVLKAPAGAKITSSNAYVNIKTTNMSMHVWAAPNAKKVKDAISQVPEIIKSEFVKFKKTADMDMPVAGTTAKHISGSGNEADDGDPGNAQVLLFAMGGHVFAGCVHGEFDDSSRALPHMMEVLQTAQPAP